ncbi:DUF7716 domain-containing protein [Paenibacillus anseongense]|uniref:DUF7716 domain-containing protein n=1 Tax=Paenibacillus anseongense TaxID=2682845 RepID=UPI002DBDA44C|nr:hypothetical protein [Paenibacillus anseongense]MEC0268309.1 hypothetical protein [Paenibacillus anseongense]
MENKLVLRNVLLNAATFSWRESLFLLKDENWTLNSKCYLFKLDDLEDDEEVSQFAIDNNLKLVLSHADIQSVVDNANQQRSQCSEFHFFTAFLYYYENDAFITFSD